MSPTLKMQSFSIVCLGQFTPAIFHPTWFKINNLLGKIEVDDALSKPIVIHRDITVFATEWLQVEIHPNRIQFRTTQAAYTESVRDLVISILKLLPQTPISALGINHDVCYELESDADWHRRGHDWVPKDMWNKILNEPGTKSLSVQGKRTDKLDGYILVRVEPSDPNQILIDINDHISVQPNGDETSATFARNVIQGHWGDCISRGNNIIDKILGS